MFLKHELCTKQASVSLDTTGSTERFDAFATDLALSGGCFPVLGIAFWLFYGLWLVSVEGF